MGKANHCCGSLVEAAMMSYLPRCHHANDATCIINAICMMTSWDESCRLSLRRPTTTVSIKFISLPQKCRVDEESIEQIQRITYYIEPNNVCKVQDTVHVLLLCIFWYHLLYSFLAVCSFLVSKSVSGWGYK